MGHYVGSSTNIKVCCTAQYCSDDKMKNEMGGACSAYGGNEKCI